MAVTAGLVTTFSDIYLEGVNRLRTQWPELVFFKGVSEAFVFT